MHLLKTLAACLIAALPILNCSHKLKFEAAGNDILGDLQERKRKLNDKGVAAEVGIGESRNLQTAVDKAELEARARLGRALESKTSSLQRKFQEEMGGGLSDHFSQTVKAISDQVLRGTTLVETPIETDGEGVYRAYGLMILDSEAYLKALSRELEADNALRDRWRASKAYKELDGEVAAYQEWKKEQSPSASAQGM